MKTTTAASTSTKLLLPLATLAAAGAIAVGSGADWSHSTEATVDVTSGTLVHEIGGSETGVAMTIVDLKPGDVVTGTVDVENTGTLDSILDLSSAVAAGSDTFSSSVDLKVTVADGGTTSTLYDGDLSSVSIDDPDREFLEAETLTYTFVVTMGSSAPDTDQGLSSSIDFSFDQRQEAGDNARTGSFS